MMYKTVLNIILLRLTPHITWDYWENIRVDSSLTDWLLIRSSVFADINKNFSYLQDPKKCLVSIWREVLYNIIDQFGVHKNLQLTPLLIKHHTMTAQPSEKQPHISSE